MAKWNSEKVLPSAINGGREFTTNDDLAIEELNAMVNNSFYGVDFAEAMADTPIVDNSNPSAEPTVELVDNVKNGKTYKRFKFSNLKGARGEQGASGEDGESAGFGTPTASIESLDVNAQPTVSVSASGNNTAKVFDFKFGIPKPSTTTDSELNNTSTNPVQNKVIANILSPSAVYNPLVLGKGASADTSQGLEYSTAIGNNASTYKNGTSLGYNAKANAYGTSVGASSSASNYSVSVGAGAHTTAQKAIQLGEGINSTENTVQFFGDNVYDHSTHTFNAITILQNGKPVANAEDVNGGSSIVVEELEKDTLYSRVKELATSNKLLYLVLTVNETQITISNSHEYTIKSANTVSYKSSSVSIFNGDIYLHLEVCMGSGDIIFTGKIGNKTSCDYKIDTSNNGTIEYNQTIINSTNLVIRGATLTSVDPSNPYYTIKAVYID